MPLGDVWLDSWLDSWAASWGLATTPAVTTVAPNTDISNWFAQDYGGAFFPTPAEVRQMRRIQVIASRDLPTAKAAFKILRRRAQAERAALQRRADAAFRRFSQQQ